MSFSSEINKLSDISSNGMLNLFHVITGAKWGDFYLLREGRIQQIVNGVLFFIMKISRYKIYEVLYCY